MCVWGGEVVCVVSVCGVCVGGGEGQGVGNVGKEGRWWGRVCGRGKLRWGGPGENWPEVT